MSENLYYRIGELETLISQLDEYVLKYSSSDLRNDIDEEALWEAIFADSVDMGPTSLCIYAFDFFKANQTALPKWVAKEMESLLAAIVPFLSPTSDNSTNCESDFVFWPTYQGIGLSFGRIISPEEVIKLSELKLTEALDDPRLFEQIKILAEQDTKYDFFPLFIHGWVSAVNKAAVERKCLFIYFL